MARRPEPWYRRQCQQYYVTIRGKQHRLGRTKKEAYRRFHELTARPERAVASGTVAELIEHFWDWTEVNRPKSYQWYKKRIDKFYPVIAPLGVSEIRPYHVQQELASAPDEAASGPGHGLAPAELAGKMLSRRVRVVRACHAAARAGEQVRTRIRKKRLRPCNPLFPRSPAASRAKDRDVAK